MDVDSHSPTVLPHDPGRNEILNCKELMALPMCTAASASGRVPVPARAGAVVSSRMQCSAEDFSFLEALLLPMALLRNEGFSFQLILKEISKIYIACLWITGVSMFSLCASHINEPDETVQPFKLGNLFI